MTRAPVPEPAADFLTPLLFLVPAGGSAKNPSHLKIFCAPEPADFTSPAGSTYSPPGRSPGGLVGDRRRGAPVRRSGAGGRWAVGAALVLLVVVPALLVVVPALAGLVGCSCWPVVVLLALRWWCWVLRWWCLLVDFAGLAGGSCMAHGGL